MFKVYIILLIMKVFLSKIEKEIITLSFTTSNIIIIFDITNVLLFDITQNQLLLIIFIEVIL